MNIGILPVWLLIGACAAAANVPSDLVAVGAALGVALSMLATTRQANFVTPAFVAALPPLWRYVLTPIALEGGQQMPDVFSKIAALASTPTCFYVAAAMSCFASWVLAVKWLHTRKV
ncbi:MULTISPECIES: hypothetical protein [Burkholderia cepacia complex]|uniref:hypothetical protein n=1 Tax=Burkholderia cepacia complex TaxID=87882 RepID=UPI0011B2191F|nr:MULTISPECIES: hypothetical protein [Burkholderia cepacia complex]MBU9546849.1 hypothetical protein [Burkholderia multivorans]MBY4754898.1 hypothetical protein [Burkholderia dolosa]